MAPRWTYFAVVALVIAAAGFAGGYWTKGDSEDATNTRANYGPDKFLAFIYEKEVNDHACLPLAHVSVLKWLKCKKIEKRTRVRPGVWRYRVKGPVCLQVVLASHDFGRLYDTVPLPTTLVACGRR